MKIDCFVVDESGEIHISNSQHINGCVELLNDTPGCTSSVCGEIYLDRSAIKKISISDLLPQVAVEDSCLCSACQWYVKELQHHTFSPPVTPVQLSGEQRSRAKQIRNSLEDEMGSELRSARETLETSFVPLDFVDRWSAAPNEFRQPSEQSSKQRVAVNPATIVGSTSPTRFIPQRIDRILYKMIHGGWDVSHQSVPVLAEYDGEYFVTEQGNHRCLAFKMLGLKEMEVQLE